MPFGMISDSDHSNTMGPAGCKLPCSSSRLLARCCTERHTRSISVCSCAHRGLTTCAGTKCPFRLRSSPSPLPPLPTDANVHVTGVCSRSCSSPCRIPCACVCIPSLTSWHALWRHRLLFGMIPDCDDSNTMGLAVCKLPCRSSRFFSPCCIQRHTRSISVCSCAHRGLTTYASTKCPFGLRSSPSPLPPLPVDTNVHVMGACAHDHARCPAV